MSNDHGKFVWYELMTSDPEAGAAFYGAVMGWSAKDASSSEAMRYTVFNVGERGAGGMMALPAMMRQAGVPPHWIGYIAVDDVDVYARKVVEAGGAIRLPPGDIPTVGRFSVVTDPHGAAFVLFRPTEGASVPPLAPDAIGHAGWRELLAGDLEPAFAFYSGLFGWTKAEVVDMGAMGPYQLFAAGAEPIGGMMTKPPSLPRAGWGFYFTVDALGAALARVKEGRGQVANGPHQVPGGHWVAQCLDPQGAFFGLTSRKP